MATLVSSPDGEPSRSDDMLSHFDSGYKDRYAPLSKHERDLLRFTGRNFDSQIDRDHAINQKFGITAPDYFRKVEQLQDHPGLSKMMSARLKGMYSRPKEEPNQGTLW